MKTFIYFLAALSIFFVLGPVVSATVVVNAEYVMVYPGEEKHVSVEISNNEDFDIEDVSLTLLLDSLPFSAPDGLKETVDDIRDGDDEEISFTLLATNDATPGNYAIPYVLTYVNEEDNDDTYKEEGTFSIRISAKTDLDFIADIEEGSFVGEEGSISLEIVNRGLGDIRSISVEIFPEGYELLSAKKVFVGSLDSDDTDLASFDVLFTSSTPTLRAEVVYKDFENVDRVEQVVLPLDLYTREEALEKGLITKNYTGIYLIIAIAMVIVWLVIRRILKQRRKTRKG